MRRYKEVIVAISSWASILLVSALAITGCTGPNAALAPTSPYYEGAYATPPPPQYSYGTPWVGTNTPWVFYQGDWFLNGVLYYFFGPQHGWAPYYAYPPTYIVRTTYWYEPRWTTWYQQHPQYVQTFTHRYPYWHNHYVGQRYDQNFYNKYHQGQGGGWQKGFHGGITQRPYPEGRRPAQTQMPPPEGHRPGSYPMTPPSQAYTPEKHRPVPAQGTYPAARGAGSAPAAPYQGSRPASVQQQPQYQREQQIQQRQKPQQQPTQQQQIKRAPQPQQSHQPQQAHQQHQPQQQPQQQQQHQEKKVPQQPGQP
jgi:hypothetical protein